MERGELRNQQAVISPPSPSPANVDQYEKKFGLHSQRGPYQYIPSSLTTEDSEEPKNSSSTDKQKKTHKSNSFKFSLLISQVAPQPDGTVHVTAGYKIHGYIILQVKSAGKPFYMSALSLSLHQVEQITIGDAEGRIRNKCLKQLYFPISEYFKDAYDQPSSKGYFYWNRGTYKFPFVIETSVEYLASFLFLKNDQLVKRAERYYYLLIRSRKSVCENDQWKTIQLTRVNIHMFRKLPAIVDYAREQTPTVQKTTKFFLRKGSLECSLSIPEQKTTYFMHYHSIPLQIEISNQTGLRIKDARVCLRQNLYYRVSPGSWGNLLARMTLWECNLSELGQFELPIPKRTNLSVPTMVIPLDSHLLTPTVVRRQHTLIFAKHFFEVTLRMPKHVSDVVVKLPLTILEPPIEHLAKAIKNKHRLQKSQSLSKSDVSQDQELSDPDEDSPHSDLLVLRPESCESELKLVESEHDSEYSD